MAEEVGQYLITFTYHIVYIKPIEQEIQAEMKDCDSHIT